jgi:N-glycosylase/DNA lyase
MEKIKELFSLYKKFHNEIQKRKQGFLDVKKDKILVLKELCFCLLTPQSKATNCWQAVEILFKKGFPKMTVPQIQSVLKKYTRFYKTKTKWIIEAAKKFDIIWQLVNKNFEPVILREILVREIKGMGYKEASHFLRNIGYSFDLAIIDRHILKNLLGYRVISSIPKSINKNRYLELEQKFIKFSQDIKIPLVDLDLLFWAKQTGVVFK